MKATTIELVDKILSESGLNYLRQSTLDTIALLCDTFADGGRVYVCGNGGSASDSEHIVGELVKSFMKKRSVPDVFVDKLSAMFPDDGANLAEHTQVGFPAFSLVSQSGIMTAVNNDIGGEYVFSQQVFAYMRKGDVLIGISTSGNSVPVANAAKVAKALDCKVVALVGKDGGVLKNLADCFVCSDKTETYRIQQEHIVVYHAVCAAVEEELI